MKPTISGWPGPGPLPQLHSDPFSLSGLEWKAESIESKLESYCEELVPFATFSEPGAAPSETTASGIDWSLGHGSWAWLTSLTTCGAGRDAMHHSQSELLTL